MAEISVDGHSMVVEMHGADKLWALHSRMVIPLAHVAGARIDAGAVRDSWGSGLKLGGARIPGHLTAGTFRQEGDWVFWDVHDPDRSLIVDLHDEHYARLVVEVDDPVASAALVNGALSPGNG